MVEGWRSQPWSLRLLRAFLGITFAYAGIQKLADPNFLHAGSIDFIGTQLREFARASPIAPILHALDHAPVAVGIGIALAELGIGLGTLAGIAPTVLAAGGFLVNLSLTLSATWHVHPYFLGSDSMYAVAWLAYLVGLVEIDRRRRRAEVKRRPAQPDAIGRRELLRGGALAGATLVAAAAASALKGAPTAAAAALGRDASSGTGTTGSDPTGATGASSANGAAIASLSSLPVGGAIGFNDPGVGPAALVRLGQNDVVAYSRVCTHAGCLVGYNSSARLLVCPCHGAEFDPANGAQPIAGPAPRPLPSIQVRIDPATGQVILPQ